METPLELPVGAGPTTPSMAVIEVLEKFLAVKTLAERLPMIKTRTPETKLAKS